MSSKNEIEKLVLATAKAAMASDDLQQKIDALKVIAPYYAIWKKKDGNDTPDAAQSLAGMVDKINKAEDEQDGRSYGLQDRRRNQ